MRTISARSAIVLLGVCAGCAGSPAAPFDSFKTAPITAYRLQNYEQPPQPVATAGAATPSLIPSLPPEIQAWIKLGASALPPGLLPPGLNAAAAAPAAPAPQVDTAPRFNGFRVIAVPVNVTDQKQRDELVDIFGFEKNFDNTHGNCMFAEFGFSFARIQQPPADVLVSLSCDQVQAQNFIWPHKNTGLTPDSVNRLTKLARAMFGG